MQPTGYKAWLPSFGNNSASGSSQPKSPNSSPTGNYADLSTEAAGATPSSLFRRQKSTQELKVRSQQAQKALLELDNTTREKIEALWERFASDCVPAFMHLGRGVHEHAVKHSEQQWKKVWETYQPQFKQLAAEATAEINRLPSTLSLQKSDSDQKVIQLLEKEINHMENCAELFDPLMKGLQEYSRYQTTLSDFIEIQHPEWAPSNGMDDHTYTETPNNTAAKPLTDRLQRMGEKIQKHAGASATNLMKSLRSITECPPFKELFFPPLNLRPFFMLHDTRFEKVTTVSELANAMAILVGDLLPQHLYVDKHFLHTQLMQGDGTVQKELDDLRARQLAPEAESGKRKKSSKNKKNHAQPGAKKASSSTNEGIVNVAKKNDVLMTLARQESLNLEKKLEDLSTNRLLSAGLGGLKGLCEPHVPLYRRGMYFKAQELKYATNALELRCPKLWEIPKTAGEEAQIHADAHTARQELATALRRIEQGLLSFPDDETPGLFKGNFSHDLLPTLAYELGDYVTAVESMLEQVIYHANLGHYPDLEEENAGAFLQQAQEIGTVLNGIDDFLMGLSGEYEGHLEYSATEEEEEKVRTFIETSWQSPTEAEITRRKAEDDLMKSLEETTLSPSAPAERTVSKESKAAAKRRRKAEAARSGMATFTPGSEAVREPIANLRNRIDSSERAHPNEDAPLQNTVKERIESASNMEAAALQRIDNGTHYSVRAATYSELGKGIQKILSDATIDVSKRIELKQNIVKLYEEMTNRDDYKANRSDKATLESYQEDIRDLKETAQKNEAEGEKKLLHYSRLSYLAKPQKAMHWSLFKQGQMTKSDERGSIFQMSRLRYDGSERPADQRDIIVDRVIQLKPEAGDDTTSADNLKVVTHIHYNVMNGKAKSVSLKLYAPEQRRHSHLPDGTPTYHDMIDVGSHGTIRHTGQAWIEMMNGDCLHDDDQIPMTLSQEEIAAIVRD